MFQSDVHVSGVPLNPSSRRNPAKATVPRSRILFDIGHPAHVHLFRHAIAHLRSEGHAVLVTAAEKEMATQLLRQFRIPYVSLGKPGAGLVAKGARLAVSTTKLMRIARRFSADVLVGVSPVRGAVAAWALRRPCVGLDDTEHAELAHLLYMPFVTTLVTPQCYGLEVGRKQIRYEGYHELAYLHPNRFRPDPSVLAQEGLDVSTPFAVVRFVSWQAVHDIGHGGFSRAGRLRLVSELARYVRVLLSTESDVDPELAHYVCRVSPHLMHHCLYYASLCVTEGATMASECAVLGTPAVYMNSLPLGYLNEQQERYGLVFNYHDRRDESMAIAEAVRIASEAGSDRQRWRTSAAKLVREHVDVTEFIVQSVADHAAGLRSRVV